MKDLVRAGFLMLSVFAFGITDANAQASQDSARKDSAVDQFKSGAQHVGEGATRIGEGIKQGAIQTWESLKAGAEATADKFKSRTATPKPSSPAARPTDDSH